MSFEWREGISIKPTVCFGKPCIKGTRIWVSLILDFLASGSTVEEILEDYPQLTQEDIRAVSPTGRRLQGIGSSRWRSRERSEVQARRA